MFVLFSTTDSLISRVIRFLTKSKASHVCLLYYDLNFRDWMIIEAAEHGFSLIQLDKFCEKNRVITILVPKYDIANGLRHISRWFSTDYDYSGLVGMSVVLFGRMIKKRFKNIFQQKRKRFCSESVVQMLQAIDYPKSDKLNASETTPDDLERFFIEGGSIQSQLKDFS